MVSRFFLGLTLVAALILAGCSRSGEPDRLSDAAEMHDAAGPDAGSETDSGAGDAGSDAGCASDQDCPDGKRCCANDGVCHATVTDGSGCDCGHPCTRDEVCLPGPCDADPPICRPGCYPGSASPPPYGTAPASCAAQHGAQAYCVDLSEDEVTTQNMGGACEVGDGCDPIAQNCPDLPLDRSQPVSAENPAMAANCVPVAWGVTECIPAGPIPVGGTGCQQMCGQIAGNCAKGGWCTQLSDSEGNPAGPPTCSQQCGTPTQNPANSTGCDAGDYCNAIFGRGMVFFSTGACAAPAPPSSGGCDSDVECASPAPYCDITDHMCVACVDQTECDYGMSCVNGVCVADAGAPGDGGNEDAGSGDAGRDAGV
jgi:hypothetical protein